MYLNWLFTNYKLQNIDFVIMLLFPHYNNNYPYKIKFSGIPSGSKSIKMLSRQWCHFYPHVISFLTNQLIVFLHAVNHLSFSHLLVYCENFI